nr:hypothetical protein [Xanthomonas campestris]
MHRGGWRLPASWGLAQRRWLARRVLFRSMQEIWLLQTRFSSRQRKRVFRTLSHPRFRAAFDFLVLRQFASADHAADVEFWRDAQQSSGQELVDAIENAQVDHDGDESAPRKRRRRRRRTGAAAGE